MAQTTTVIIPGRPAITNIPGFKTAQQIINMYGSEISGLRNMDSTVNDNGENRTIEFRHKTGTKGAQTTTVIIPGRPAITNIPGFKTAQQIINMYGSEISGLRNMDSTVNDNGENRTIEFRHKTGTKGK